MSGPRVLVTGALGKIASRILPLIPGSDQFLLTDIRPAEGRPSYRQVDLMDFSQVYSLLEGIDTIVHLAMAPSVQEPAPPPGELSPGDLLRLDVNMGATFRLLEGARQRGVRTFIYASSITTMLGNQHLTHYTPDMPPDPKNLYACTKLFGEQLGRVYARSHGINVICLRIGQPFPVDLPEYDALWKTNVRARSYFVEIPDIARAIAGALQAEVGFGVFHVVSASDNQRFDISDGVRIGYVPRSYLTSEGIQYFDHGDFPPPPAAVTTHNPGELEAAGDGKG